MTILTGTVYDADGVELADATVRVYRRDTGALLGECVTGDGSAGELGDEYYNSVSLLMHCNGDNNSTTFVDNSSSPTTLTRQGNVVVSTNQYKYGAASLYFSPSDFLTASSAAKFGLGTGDHTIEYWMWPELSGDNNQVIIDLRAADGNTYGLIGITKAGAIRVYDGVTARTGGTVSANAWQHVAWVRASNVNRVYLAGVQVITWTASQDAGELRPLTIGINVVGAADRFTGYIDDIRITKGVARYTDTFIPPSAAFLDSLYIPAKPLGTYSLNTAYSGEVQRIILDPDGNPLQNDLIDRIILP